jgi:hypothetical protein
VQGVKEVRKDKRGAYVPPGQEEPKEVVVTLYDVVPMELQGAIEKVLQAGIGV